MFPGIKGARRERFDEIPGESLLRAIGRIEPGLRCDVIEQHFEIAQLLRLVSFGVLFDRTIGADS
ncbi:hypothetical protein GR138_25705 [Shinella kummerowiae]|jgi:hypothetical protein|uniref:Uncharacterized protein n=1 Tax=Shinella kummerowiae TaxID=417745 RepID=A0A6N8SJE8_9HYPH|nr:hypothetical protein [Shinella kummerowiae]MXN48607.1 hypothetical protein [Shinella kummerowiae]